MRDMETVRKLQRAATKSKTDEQALARAWRDIKTRVRVDVHLRSPHLPLRF